MQNIRMQYVLYMCNKMPVKKYCQCGYLHSFYHVFQKVLLILLLMPLKYILRCIFIYLDNLDTPFYS